MSVLDYALDAPVSSIVTALVALFFVASLIGGHSFTEKTYLVLSDTVGEKFYIWNIVTSGLLETNIIKVAADIAWITYAGRRVESALGVESMAIFVNVVILAGGVVVSTALFSLYVLFRFEVFLFMSTYGCGGLAAALAVALKLLCPKDAPLPTLPALQHQHLPLLFCLLSLIGWAGGLDAVAGLAKDTPFVIVGTFTSWWYLRFVQRHPVTGHPDVSEDFAFVTLFPPGLRPYLSPLADFCYGVGLLLGYFKERKKIAALAAAQQAAAAAGSLGAGVAGGGLALGSSLHHGGSNPDLLGGADGAAPVETDPIAERRRAKAREQLDAKLAAMANQDEEWDDEDDDGK